MKRILFTALVLALVLPGMAKAQTTDGGTIAVNIGELLYVDITAGDNQTLTPALADFDAGFDDAASLTVLSGANAPYDLLIEGDNAAWAYNDNGSGNADPSKPVADLLFQLSGGSGYTAMTTSPQTVESFAAPGTNSSTVDLRVALDYADDVEGIYTMNYTVSVVAP
ncbi:MAG: hypothetical protein M8861_08990 [marine benthic group bacterium]|nr:hypothetical protein [Gemmatimonadota bacterium]